MNEFIQNLNHGETGTRAANRTFTRRQLAALTRLLLPSASENLGQVLYVADGKSTLATLTTDLAGDNNDLVFTAVQPGTLGNDITVAYVDPAENDAELSVVVTGTDIVVNLATGSGGAITSTADEVLAAVEAATGLVTVDDASGSTGAGVVTALAETSLASAIDVPCAVISDGGDWVEIELGSVVA